MVLGVSGGGFLVGSRRARGRDGWSGPYLRAPGRLQEVLAAIQVLGVYEYAAREPDRWENRLGGPPKSAGSCRELFGEHPEFFTSDGEHQAALVWRRSFPRDYDTTTTERVSVELRESMKSVMRPSDGQLRLTRPPLNIEQIEVLCNLAVSLHEREIQHRQELRWWFAGVLGIITALIAVIG